MDAYLLQEHWATLVQDLKDSEKIFGQDAYITGRITQEILRYATYTRFRQYNLFSERRGEEYEKMLELLQKMEFDMGSVRRILEDEQFWKITLELSER